MKIAMSADSTCAITQIEAKAMGDIYFTLECYC